MDKARADLVLIELVGMFENMDLDHFKVIQSIGADRSDYSVAISAFLSTVKKQELLELAKKNGYRLTENKEALIIH